MQSTARDFKHNVDARARRPATCRRRSAKLKVGFSERRRQAVERLPEFEALRDAARDIKDHALANLDFYLEAFERKVTALGGHVHWARDAAEARAHHRRALPRASARARSTKGKSMIAEEIGSTITSRRTASRRSRPISANTSSSSATSRRATSSRRRCISPRTRSPTLSASITASSASPSATDRAQRRWSPRRATCCAQKFLDADVGITGANFLVAETGSSIIVTNEGNGDLTQHAAQDAYRARQHREGRADARGCGGAAARAGALGDRPGISAYTTLIDRAQARRRPRRAGAVSRRPARQWPLRGARHRVPGHAALHPLRRLHEPLPGLSARSAAMPMAGSIPARSARC